MRSYELSNLAKAYPNFIYDGFHQGLVEIDTIIYVHRWIPRFNYISDKSTCKVVYYSCSCYHFDEPTDLTVVVGHIKTAHNGTIHPFKIREYTFQCRISYFGDYFSVWKFERSTRNTYLYSCNGCHNSLGTVEYIHQHLVKGECNTGRLLRLTSYFAYDTQIKPIKWITFQLGSNSVSPNLQWDVFNVTMFSCLCMTDVTSFTIRPNPHANCTLCDFEIEDWFGGRKFIDSSSFYFPLNIPRAVLSKYLTHKSPAREERVIQVGSLELSNKDVWKAIKIRRDLQTLPSACCAMCGTIGYHHQYIHWPKHYFNSEAPVMAFLTFPQTAYMINDIDGLGRIKKDNNGTHVILHICSFCKRNFPARSSTPANVLPKVLPQPKNIPTILCHSRVRERRALSMVNVHYGKYKRTRDVEHARIEGDCFVKRFCVSTDHQDFSGMISALHYGRAGNDDSTASFSTSRVISVLRKLNPLFERFTTNLEAAVHDAQHNTPNVTFNSEDAGEDPAMIVGNINASNQVRTDALYTSIGFTTNRTSHERAEVFTGHRLFEPLAFPYLYPTGSRGYDKDLDTSFTLSKMIKARIMSSDSRWREDMSWIFIHVDQYLKDRVMGCQRFTTANTLRNRITAGQLRRQPASIVNAIHKDVPGTAEHLYSKQLDVECIIRKRGIPHVFVTFSCDYNVSYMRMVSNRNDIDVACTDYVVKWFIVKNTLLRILRTPEAGFGEHDYTTTRCETQDRSGRFHSHTIMRLRNPRLIHLCTTAHFPDIANVDTIENRYLYDLVKRLMVHNCLRFRCMRHGTCKYKFPRTPVTQTYFNEVDRRYYVERSAESERVVPYSPFLMIAFGVHTNVELIGKNGAHRYLTKYQTKPISTVHCRDRSNSAMVKYLRGRVLPFPQVVAIAMGFSVLPIEGAAVENIHLGSPANLICSIRANFRRLADDDTNVFHADPFTKYATRPSIFESMTVSTFFSKTFYTKYRSKIPKYILDQESPPFGQHSSNEFRGYSYLRKTPTLIRFSVHDPLSGENFFAMVYNYFKAHRGHLQDFATYNADNFEALCGALGLISSPDQTPILIYQRILRLEGFDDDYIAKKVQRVQLIHYIQEHIHYDAYVLQAELIDHNRQLQSIRNIEEPDMVLSFITTTILHMLLDKGLNTSQLRAFEIILRTIIFHPHKPLIFLVQGCPGTGKSYLLQCIIQFFKHEGLRTVCSSTTNISASQLHREANTIHSNYRIFPNASTKQCVSFMTPFSPKAQLISTLQLGVCDEFSFIGKSLLDGMCVSHSKCHPASIDRCGGPFGNNIYIFTGDAAQLPSTEYDGDCTTEFWNQSKVIDVAIPITLDTYVRASCIQLQEFIEYFYLPSDEITPEQTSSALRYLDQCICKENNCRQVPDGVKHFGMVTKREKRNQMNRQYIERFLPSTTEYKSVTTLKESTIRIPSTSNNMRALNKEFNIQETVHLVSGMIVLLIKNICKRFGLKNGVRMKVITLHESYVTAYMLNDPTRTAHIIKLESETVHANNREYERVGIPFIPAYYSTTHKLQGITCPGILYIHIDATTSRELGKEFFDPQLFLVQISRVKQLDKIHIHWPGYTEELGRQLINMKDSAAHEWIIQHKSKSFTFGNSLNLISPLINRTQ